MNCLMCQSESEVSTIGGVHTGTARATKVGAARTEDVPGSPQYGTGHGTQLYDPFQNQQCSSGIADTLYFGFGFEGISGAATRTTVMGNAVRYLLR
jgi:hypothetical protein